MMDDPELQEIFGDPGDKEVLDLLKSARPKTPPLDPNFRSYLRAKLMTEAQRTLPRRASQPWFTRLLGPRLLAPAMATVAAGLLVVLGVEVYLHNQATPPSNLVGFDVRQINNKTDVATVEPIRIQFSGPVDKTAVAESVVIDPATAFTEQWEGSTLLIIPNHPLAPNTNYTVTFKPKAVGRAAAPSTTSQPAATATPAVAPTPVTVHFQTVRAPIPPVAPPSFRSSNVTYGNDNRLADAGSIINATWTAGGQQILATRPAQPGRAPASTPSGPAVPPTRTTDVWLMSLGGVPLRVVAPDGTLPSAPASGNLFAAWSLTGTQARLDVRDLQGALIASVATVDGTPQQPAVWLGTDRLAYVDNGSLHVVDLHGAPIALPRTIKVDQGAIAASASGTLLAVEAVDGPVVVDLTAPSVTALPAGATGFDWSAKGDLAFVVRRDSGTELYVASDWTRPVKVATSPSGQAWSDLNWAPDATSLLLATKPAGGSNGTSGLLVINRDGSDPTKFGPSEREYASPEWSPSGDLVLFTRHDDATGATGFWTATASTSGNNVAEQQALAEVDTFIKARMRGDSAAAQGELDNSARAAYDAGTSALMSAAGTSFDRYYPVTVQVTGTNQFLIGVRIFIAKTGGSETSFFEEQLTVVQQGQRYVIHAVKASPIRAIGHGPTVLSFQVVDVTPGQEVQVHFDADLDPTTVNGNTIKITTTDGQPINARVTFDADHHLARIGVKLKTGTYQLVVTTGVTDIKGATLAQEYDATLVVSD